MSGKNPGDAEVVKDWLRKLRKAHEVLEFRLPLSDYTYVQTCEGNSKRIQLYHCTERIAEILGLDIKYKHTHIDALNEDGLYTIMEFEGAEYFEYTSIKKGDNDGSENIGD